MKKDQIIIFSLVGIMLFSVIATGLLLVTSDSDDNNLNDFEDIAICETPADLATAAGNEPSGQWPVEFKKKFKKLETNDLTTGEGRELALGDCMVAHYRLALADGTPVPGNDTFQTSVPFATDFIPGGLIQGWIDGLVGLKEGGVRRLKIPANLAYGENPPPNSVITENADLVFDVELLRIVQ